MAFGCESTAIFGGNGSVRVFDLRESAFGAGAVLLVEVDAVETTSSLPEQFCFFVQALVIFVDLWMGAS